MGATCWHPPCSTTTATHNVAIISESHILYHTTTISNPVSYVNALSPSFNSSLDILILQVSISTRFFSLGRVPLRDRQGRYAVHHPYRELLLQVVTITDVLNGMRAREKQQLIYNWALRVRTIIEIWKME
ncbi:hypothetical protein BBBOND_0309160 [Babesia bigemina]|uniref:Uncharacterized protein n=1 Tax=Babesia bigemina TaxID=5866 RepID=A0A061D8Y8_BABBI|nr:hypothetical protein BBBOND_0309160 [Babesia bigemina]CDR97013.1 hypothetical protein BBBOND_0309160 [Babesia bigemina]|eukprot:XP_012769199.1 hypothetical protein BBBOND_0309160 [Babesia bigemina]